MPPPYFVFRDAGVELTLASPKGGEPPIDPKRDLTEHHGRGAPLITFYDVPIHIARMIAASQFNQHEQETEGPSPIHSPLNLKASSARMDSGGT